MDNRPNIIFIITDQQRFDTINALGFDYMETPNIDKLVKEGVSFNNCFITAPSCAPARASLFNGYYPHTSGIYKNADDWKHGWIEDLSKSGYTCVNVGKMHTWPYTTPCGFQHRFVVENKDRYLEGRYFYDEWDKYLRSRGIDKPGRVTYRERDDYDTALGAFTWDLPEEAHSDMFVGDMANWWLDNYPVDGPLFLEIGFPGPHPPYDPTSEYLDKNIDKDLPLLEVTEEEMAGLPPGLAGMRVHNTEVDHDSIKYTLNPTEEMRHRQRAHYLANVTMIDQKIGEIMDNLEKKGMLDNSVVIFSSDHGDCLTDHGQSQKWSMYDIVNRVPMIVWGPKYFEGGRTVEDLIQNMDVGPALLEMAGARIDPNMQAKSVLPVLKGEEWSGRKEVFAEQVQDKNFTCSEYMSMIRDEEWKLVHFMGEDHGQLFDLKADPDEVNNLFYKDEFSGKKAEMTNKLLNWYMSSQYEACKWAESWR
ncbi:MAG: sulfatase-like hydrolase/transferase [Lentisphaerales bacterium]|nr:sulfatase-like hydrolase/transferase [Lentisphaerales bacterium]